jgi:hypothetical protein
MDKEMAELKLKWMERVKQMISKERLKRQYKCRRDYTVWKVFNYFRETALLDGVSIEYGDVDILWNKSVKEAFSKEWEVVYPGEDRQLKLF